MVLADDCGKPQLISHTPATAPQFPIPSPSNAASPTRRGRLSRSAHQPQECRPTMTLSDHSENFARGFNHRSHNERNNLPELLQRISAALVGIAFEVIIVDDNSKDATPTVCAEFAQNIPSSFWCAEYPHQQRTLRAIAARHGTGPRKISLRHGCRPPASSRKTPRASCASLKNGTADFVLGSRYMPGSSTEIGMERHTRKLNSRVATFLARPFAGKTTDPMAGFFALHQTSYANARQLTPSGYKIALELMCKSGVKNVIEIPICFANRSKRANPSSPSNNSSNISSISVGSTISPSRAPRPW